VLTKQKTKTKNKNKKTKAKAKAKQQQFQMSKKMPEVQRRHQKLFYFMYILYIFSTAFVNFDFHFVIAKVCT